MFELAVEVTAHPAEKKKSHGEEGGANGHDKGFGIPTVVEKVVEENEAEGEEANEADEHTERHEHGLEDCAFALTGKPFGTMGESSHGEAKMFQKMKQGSVCVKSQNRAREQLTAKYGWSADSGILLRYRFSPRQ